MQKIRIPVVGGHYKHDSLSFDAQTCINLYPEIGGRQSGSGSILRRRPGLLYKPDMSRDDTLFTFPLPDIVVVHFNDFNGPVRGLYASNTRAGGGELLYIAVGNRVGLFYRNLEPQVSGVAYFIGDAFRFGSSLMNTRTGSRVHFAENNTHLICCDGTNIYYTNKLSGSQKVGVVLNTVTDATAPDTTPQIEVIDGYAFGFVPGSNAGVFNHSNLNDVTTWDAADTYTAEGSSDPIIAIKGFKRHLWIFGTNTFEVWRNTGIATRTWAIIPGTLTNIGCNARWSVQTGFGRIFWLGGSSDSNNIIFINEGFGARRISNHAIEEKIGSFAKVDDATAFTYQKSGHQFYEISFPTGDKTFVYDLTSNEWTERAYRNPNTGAFERNLPVYHAYFESKNYVTSRNDNGIYEYDEDYFFDDITLLTGSANIPGNSNIKLYEGSSKELTWERTFPYVNNNRGRIFWHSLEIGIQTGVGLTSGQGSDPVIAIRWSDDGAQSWSNWHSMSIGKIGKYRTRAIKYGLGYSHSHGRTFQIRGSDPVVTNIQDNAVAEVTFGN